MNRPHMAAHWASRKASGIGSSDRPTTNRALGFVTPKRREVMLQLRRAHPGR